MNFLCHAIPYLDEHPLLAISTGIPDWLSVVDRKIRARKKLAIVHVDSPDSDLQSVAKGVIKHIEDDLWFHTSESFVTMNLQLAVELRDLLPGDTGFRPMFVGHVIIEMLLDSFWIQQNRDWADRYFRTIDSLDAEMIESCVNQITGKPTDKLAGVIERFVEVKFLFDYLDNDGILLRMNQVMKRVRLQPLPDSLLPWMQQTRELVESRAERLLSPASGETTFPFA